MLLTLLTTLVTSPQAYTCAALARGVTWAAAPGLSVALKRTGDATLRITAAGQSRTVPITCFQNESQVRVEDYNFDGIRDFAVPTSVGYGSVNVFGRVFFTDAAADTFRPSAEVEFGNSAPDPVRRVLEGGVKSGPAHVVVTNCLTPDGLNFYTCRELTPVWNSPHADDYAARWFSPDGRTLAARPFDPARQAQEWTVTAARAFFHARPDAAARGAAYVVRGDRVEVIELRGTWARVAYTPRVGRVTVGWLPRASLR